MLTVSVMRISPELAKEWLASNVHNRTINQAHVDMLAREMSNGRWYLTNQGIAFYDDGTLADGQHRLHAIVQSGKTVQMQVTQGMSKDAMMGIDTNRVRSVSDIISLKNDFGRVTAQEVAILKLAYKLGQKVSPDEINQACEQSLQDVRDIWSLMQGKPIEARTIFAAALLTAKASGVSMDDIRQFTTVLVDGIPSEDRDKTVLVLRDAALRKAFSRGGSAWRDTYLRQIQGLLARFVKGDVAKNLSNFSKFTYPKLTLS